MTSKDFYTVVYNHEKRGDFPKSPHEKDLITNVFLEGALLALSLVDKNTNETWHQIVDHSMAADEMVRLMRLNPGLTDVDILSKKAEQLPQRIRSWERMGIWAPYGDGPQNDYYNSDTQKWENKSK